MEALLEAEELTKIFQRDGREPVTALDRVSFRLYPGEALGVVGESGSGKSTLARAVTRLMDVTAGAIRLEGQDITWLRGRALRDIRWKTQMVFQDPAGSFDPRRTLGDSVGESLRSRGRSRREAAAGAAALLAQCGLPPELSGRYPHQVSGGQCQRAAIARALAAGPRVLICDEATSSLDATVQAQIMALLRALREESGLACLFITHDLALAQSFCSRLLVMEDGHVAEEGSADQVIAHPRSACARRLVDAAL